jgi:hypothetical protein
MNEMITKFLNNAQSTVAPVVPVIGVFLIIRGLLRLANGNEAVRGGCRGRKAYHYRVMSYMIQDIVIRYYQHSAKLRT